MVNVGDTAPQFELKDQHGNMVSLQSYKGKKVLLAFYPFAFSPPCTEELTCFRDDLSQFASKGTSVVGISVDSHYANKAFAEHLKVSYPLLSDFGKDVCKAYGTLRPEGFSNRAYFVVDGQGKVVFKQIMDTPPTLMKNEELLAGLK
jgi:peroxiredoxin